MFTKHALYMSELVTNDKHVKPFPPYVFLFAGFRFLTHPIRAAHPYNIWATISSVDLRAQEYIRKSNVQGSSSRQGEIDVSLFIYYICCIG